MGLQFGSSKLSIFSFLDLRSPGKMCYNYIKKGERKKTFAGFAQWFSSNLSMRLSGENEGKRESDLFCYQTFATKKREEKIPPQESGKYPPKSWVWTCPYTLLYSLLKPYRRINVFSIARASSLVKFAQTTLCLILSHPYFCIASNISLLLSYVLPFLSHLVIR